MVKAFTGLPAEEFWALVAAMSERWADCQRQQRAPLDRQRAAGGGRRCERELALRLAVVLTYLRLRVPQAVVGLLFGTSQAAVSRELRAVLPALRDCLPCPAVGATADDVAATPLASAPVPEQVGTRRVLIDATEQRVSRPGDAATQRRYSSGKQKAHTLKTQLVTDDDHRILAVSAAVPGATPDQPRCDARHTLDRLPDQIAARADKGYQGLAAPVATVARCDVATRAERCPPRLTVETPHQKPQGGELPDEQRAFNRQLGIVRIRVEHCIGWPKQWAVLATRFRCAHHRYTPVMQIIGGLGNAQTARWHAANAAYCE